MINNADFYLGIGRYARYLGSIEDDGDIATLDDVYDLFGFAVELNETRLRSSDRPTLYTEGQWVERVGEIIKDANDGGMTAWPWLYADSRSTRYTYAWNNGNITAWIHGRQIMLAYPNLSRNEAVFPDFGDQIKPGPRS